MKLKYYMRGLGIGIVVTALLMGFALSKQKEPMTDEEIRQRALEMGMIEQNGVLADDLGKTEEELMEEAAENPDENSIISENEIEDKAENKTEEVKDNQSETKADPKAGENGAQEAEAQETETVEGETVIITVSGGDGSRTVANKLWKAGLIEDAAAYDTYLCQNGYDKKIAAGIHEIPVGATPEEITREITTRKN